MDDITLAELIELRRDLHQHPEVRFAEHRTAKVLAAQLAGLGFTVTEGVGGTGVLATMDSGLAGPHVMLRADMDALPTTDIKAVAYASQTPGIAHACGHDVHCAVVMGAARLLVRDDALAGGGRLTILYQPAEEIPFGETSGAAAVLETGLLQAEPPSAVFGIHCWPHLPSGTIGLDERTAMASKLAFKVSVRGKGAHAATPQLGADALLGASQIVVALHTVASRELDPSDRVAMNVGTIASGSSQSIVAANAELSGTVRTVRKDVGERLKASIERVSTGVAAAYGLTAVVDWKNEMPAVLNDPSLVDRAREVIGWSEDVEAVTMIADPPMTADDFALYAERWPSLYMKLGVARPGARAWPSLHDGAFDVDEACIRTGAIAMARVAADALAGAPTAHSADRDAAHARSTR